MEPYRHHIVCVGCNNYDDSRISNLRWAKTDAIGLAEAWQQYESAVVNAENILISGQLLKPTRSNVLACLDSLGKALTEHDILWFFFSGHGVVTNDMHRLILADTKLSKREHSFELLEQTSLDVASLVRFLRHSKAGYIVMFLDCCVDILPDSEKSLVTYRPKPEEQGQDLASIGVLWSQRAKEVQDLKNGALTKVWLDTLLAQERLEEPKHQAISVYFDSLQEKYEDLRLAKPTLYLPPLDLVCNLNRWHMPTLKASEKIFQNTDTSNKYNPSFSIDFPTPDTDGRFVHEAYGQCKGQWNREGITYYVVLQDRPSALYCQYPPLIIDDDGHWKAKRVIVGHGITRLHIVAANTSLAADLQRLESQNFFGALPKPITAKVNSSKVASVSLKPYSRSELQ